jgi:hypothetical protein
MWTDREKDLSEYTVVRNIEGGTIVSNGDHLGVIADGSSMVIYFASGNYLNNVVRIRGEVLMNKVEAGEVRKTFEGHWHVFLMLDDELSKMMNDSWPAPGIWIPLAVNSHHALQNTEQFHEAVNRYYVRALNDFKAIEAGIAKQKLQFGDVQEVAPGIKFVLLECDKSTEEILPGWDCIGVWAPLDEMFSHPLQTSQAFEKFLEQARRAEELAQIKTVQRGLPGFEA